MAKLGFIFIGFIIAIYQNVYGHLNGANAVQVNVTWIVGKKVNKYGDDLVLVCLSDGHKIGDKTMRWYKNKDELISMNDAPSNSTKYKAELVYDRVRLTIKTLEKSDVNITYYCSFRFDDSPKRLLLEGDVFNKEATLPKPKGQIEEDNSTVIYIIVSIVVCLAVVIVVICIVKKKMCALHVYSTRYRARDEDNVEMEASQHMLENGHQNGTRPNVEVIPGEPGETAQLLNEQQNGFLHNGDINHAEERNGIPPDVPQSIQSPSVHNGGIPVQNLDSNNSCDRRSAPSLRDSNTDSEPTTVHSNSYWEGDESIPGPSGTSASFNASIQQSQDPDLSYKGFVDSHYSGMSSDSAVAISGLANNLHVTSVDEQTNEKSFDDTDNNDSIDRDNEQARAIAEGERIREQKRKFQFTLPDEFPDDSQQVDNIGFVDSHYSGMSSDSAVAISGLANDLHVTSVDEQTDEKSFDDTDNNDSIDRDNEQARAIEIAEGERVKEGDEFPDDSQQGDNIGSQHNEGSSGSQQRNNTRREYSNQTLREKSYDSNPWSEHPTPKELAKAGFFYLATRKSTVCYSCGKKINWEENQSQDPLNPIFHKENCQHLKNLKP